MAYANIKFAGSGSTSTTNLTPVAAAATAAALRTGSGILSGVLVTATGTAGLTITDGPGGKILAAIGPNAPVGWIAFPVPVQYSTSVYVNSGTNTPCDLRSLRLAPEVRDMPLGPLDMIQGATKRCTLFVTNTIPATPPVSATVAGNVITFTGTPGTGLSAVVTVTTALDVALTFNVAYDDDAPLNEIAGVTASQITYTDGSDPSQNFGATSNGASVTIGSTQVVRSVAIVVSQSNIADLTGCTALMNIRKAYGATPILVLSTPDGQQGGLTIDTVAGSITFEITAEQSAALPVNFAAVSTTTNAYSSGYGSAGIVPSVKLPFNVAITYPSTDVDIIDDPVNAPLALTVYGG